MRPSRLYGHVRTHDWFAVTIDFVIVVLGVYVAVWASNQQAEREREQRTGRVVAALRQDLRDALAVEQTFEAALAPAFAAFNAARARGETPAPVFLRISGSDTPPRSPCLGVLQAEIAELVDPTLLWELCFYYDERDGIAQKFVRYTVFTENEVLPRLKEDPRVFYTEDRKRLVLAFDSHMDRLQEWRRDLTTIHQWARCLDDRLREPASAGPSCRPSVGGTIDVGRRNRPRWRPSRLCDAVTTSDGLDCRHDAVEAHSSVTINAAVLTDQAARASNDRVARAGNRRPFTEGLAAQTGLPAAFRPQPPVRQQCVVRQIGTAARRRGSNGCILPFQGVGPKHPRGVERRFDNLKVAINGTEYTLNGSFNYMSGSSGSPQYTSEIRIINNGTLVARIYGDVGNALTIEVLVPLVPL